MQIEQLHHVAIIVTDMERARRFYGELLGLKEVERPPFDFGGAWYQIGDRQLHLIVYPEALAVRRTTKVDTRDGHFAVRVRSFDDTLAFLQSRGVDCLAYRDNLTPWAQIYVTDPDGNIIELNAER